MLMSAFLLVVFVLAAGVLVWIFHDGGRRPAPKPSRPAMRKAPARYVSLPESEDLTSFMDVYNLEWKPVMDAEPAVPDAVRAVMEGMEKISPLVTELSTRLNDPEVSPQEISRLIVQDQGLTSYILKRVNSPYYGLLQKVDSIFNAIVILGYNEIYRIVMEERTRKAGIRPDKAEWVHSNLTSNIAAYLSGVCRIGVMGGTMVTAGMLHDIARTVLAASMPPPEGGFSKDPRTRLRQETEHYGIDHAALGGALARQWGMPPKLSSCIAGHHWPMFRPVRELAKSHGEIVKELSVLAVSDVAARHFIHEITGPYIGGDYYRFINKPPRVEDILVPELTRDLKRIHRIMFDEAKEGEGPFEHEPQG
jgi:HD-like signal output (HDOD) protein